MAKVEKVQIKRALAPARGVSTSKIERLKADGWQIVDTRRVNGMVEHTLIRPDYAAKMRDARKQRLREGRQYKREARRDRRRLRKQSGQDWGSRLDRWLDETKTKQEQQRLAKARDPLRGQFVPRNDPRHPKHPNYRPPVWEHADAHPRPEPPLRSRTAHRPGRWGPVSTVARWFDRADGAWIARRERRAGR